MKTKTIKCASGTKVREWIALLNLLDDLEAALLEANVLDRGALSLALEQLGDIQQALLEVRPR